MARGIMQRKGKDGDVTYYIRYQFSGKDVRERVGRKSRGFTLEMAKEALKSRLGEIAQGRFNLGKTRKPVPFSTLAEQYREFGATTKRAWEDEKYVTEMFAQRFGDTPLSQITQWEIEKWKAERSKSVKGNTVNRQLTVIKHMLHKAVEWGMIAINPASAVKRVTINDQRTRFLTVDEFHLLLAECRKQEGQPWLAPLVLLAAHTGMRKGELLGLRWETIDLGMRTITVKQGKTQRIKTIVINEPAHDALIWFLGRRYGDYVIMWPWGKRVGSVTVYDAFNRACEAAKISDFRFNDLRHTFASHLAMTGADLLTLKDLLGHTNIQMTTRYAHLFQEHKTQAVTRLAERLKNPSANAPDAKAGVADQVTVSAEIKKATDELQPMDLAQSRHISYVRKGRGLKIVKEIEGEGVARDRIELPTRGFSVL